MTSELFTDCCRQEFIKDIVKSLIKAKGNDEKIYKSTGLTDRQHVFLMEAWYERAQNWMKINRLTAEEFLVRQVILPDAIHEKWKVDEEKLSKMAALMAVLAVEDFLEERKRSQVEIATEAGISRRAWQKTWEPRCDYLYDSLLELCEQNVR